MKIDVQRVERRREVRVRTNRAHVKAFLNSVVYNADESEMPEDAHAMRPYVFGDPE